MDGFERALRAYSSMNAAYQEDIESPLPSGEGKGEGETDCVNINAEIFLKSVCSLPNIKSKVLMTTRLTPRAVKPRGEFMLGCREIELTAMQPADAVEFFQKQKIKGTHAEIEAACASYGYHPLSLRLLAGRILKDFENPADIVVAQKLKIDGDIIQQKHHVLEVSYNSLPPHEQKLLSTIACFRSPVELKTLQSIAENKDNPDNDLHNLVARGLLHFDDKNTKFDLHPIVRRYAYECLTAPDRTVMHSRLIDYFKAVPKPKKVEKLEDLAPVIELYHHMVRAGKYNEAEVLLYERLKNLYFQFDAYQLITELTRSLFIDGEDKLPPLDTDDKKAWTLNKLANTYSRSGQPRRAVPVFQNAILLAEKIGYKENIAIGLGNMAGMAQIHIGALGEAEHNLRRRIDLCREIKDIYGEANGYHDLAGVLSYCGKWGDAEQAETRALFLIQKLPAIQAEGTIWAYRAQRFLLMARDRSKVEGQRLGIGSGHRETAIECAVRALELAEEYARTTYPIKPDFVRAHWLLGAAYRLNKQLDLSEHHLSEAITRCRAINLVECEADIILDIARLLYDQKNYKEAKALAEEALLITERCGYVLQGADVNLFLAQYALEQEKDKVKAKEYAESALKLAMCDGPPYYYKVAYEEAERMLAGL